MSVQGFMDEFLGVTQENPVDDRERVLGDAVFFQLRPFPSAVRLCNIRVASPGCGTGTKGLIWLLSLADKHGVSLVGEAEPTGACELDAASLRAWYRRHGFLVSSRGDIEYTPECAR